MRQKSGGSGFRYALNALTCTNAAVLLDDVQFGIAQIAAVLRQRPHVRMTGDDRLPIDRAFRKLSMTAIFPAL